MASSVLFIGGTGQISLPCVAEAVQAGHRVTVFNRGTSDAALPQGVEVITGQMGDAAYSELGRRNFDTVAQFIAFQPDQIDRDLRIFGGHCGQYLFISSASAYEKPPRHYLITEATPAINPFWTYSQAKIDCEARLHASSGVDWTIVRPSHTLRTGIPVMIGSGPVTARRMLEGRPVIVAGDGNTPWTLTRAEDFARPFVRLFGNPRALHDTFHITGDRAFIWDDIFRAVAALLGVAAQIVHVPTDTLIRHAPEWRGSLLGDKGWTAIFDNSKIKRVAGDFRCADTLPEILAEPVRHIRRQLAADWPPEDDFDRQVDHLCAAQNGVG